MECVQLECMEMTSLYLYVLIWPKEAQASLKYSMNFRSLKSEMKYINFNECKENLGVVCLEGK